MRQHSALTARYNGFMLGHFVAVAALRPVSPSRYRILRRAVQGFLSAHHLPDGMPERIADYRVDPLAYVLRMLEGLQAESPECASTAWLSSAAIFRARGATVFRGANFAAAADALRLDAAEVRAYVRAVPRGRTTISALLAPAMAFLVRLIEDLRVEPRTCFVAMPFRRPFEQRYLSFYRPALEHLGYRTLRAWGGVGMEDYLEVILALLRKCGACMAEVTTRNPNVLYELGAAQGLGKKALIVSAGPPEAVPANVAQHTAFRFHYRTAKRGWQREEVLRFAAQTALAEFALLQEDDH